MNILHLDELKQLPGMIRSLPPHEFNMCGWFAELSCGTFGCVIGHGIHRGIISGMTLDVEDVRATVVTPRYGLLWDFPAIESYFGLPGGMGRYLFASSEYSVVGVASNDREAVAARIEQFIAEHAPERIFEMKHELEHAHV